MKQTGTVYVFKNKKRIFSTTLWTVGDIIKKCRVSLAKSTSKGYLLIVVVDFRSDGWEGLGTIRPADGDLRRGGAMARAWLLAAVGQKRP